MGYAGYGKLYFATQEWLYVYSLLGWETKMWAVLIVWHKIYLLKYISL
jgi:hypothetical protein